MNSSVLALVVTGASLLVSLPLAWLTVRTDLPGRRVWTVLTTLPLVFPSYVGGFALVAMMGPRGIVQSWLEPLGVDRLPAIYGLPGAAWALTLFTYPYLLLSIRAGLRSHGPGCRKRRRAGWGFRPWQAFWRVTLPRVCGPASSAGSLLVWRSTCSATSVRCRSCASTALPASSMSSTVSSFDRSLAALLSLVLVALTTVVLLFAAHGHPGPPSATTAPGVGARAQTGRGALGLVDLAGARSSAQRVVTAALCHADCGHHRTGSCAGWRRANRSSRSDPGHVEQRACGSALAAAVSVVLALPVSYLAVRYPSRLQRACQPGPSTWGMRLPGIVVALSLVFLGANYAIFFYQTTRHAHFRLHRALSAPGRGCAARQPAADQPAAGRGGAQPGPEPAPGTLLADHPAAAQPRHLGRRGPGLPVRA